MGLTLFSHPASPFVRKVKIVLREKGLDFEEVYVNPYDDPATPGHDRWRALSPRLEVPTLADGDFPIFDSTIMLEYLDERWPETSMSPADPAERARVRMLEELCDTDLEAVNWGIMEVMIFGRATGEIADQMIATAHSQLHRLFGRLNRELEGRTWMNGESFGRGDAAVYPHVAASVMFGVAIPDECAALADWFSRTGVRDSVVRDGADVNAWLEANNYGTPEADAPPMKRQYRDYRLEWMMKSGGAEIVRSGMDAGNIKFSNEFE